MGCYSLYDQENKKKAAKAKAQREGKTKRQLNAFIDRLSAKVEGKSHEEYLRIIQVEADKFLDIV